MALQRMSPVVNLWRRFRAALGAEKSAYQAVISESTHMNIRRLFIGACMAVPLHILCITLFMLKVTENAVEARWRLGILWMHWGMLTMMLSVIAYTACAQKRDGVHAADIAFVRCTYCLLIAAGIAIVALDQLVTSAITPFLAVCLVTGALLVDHPFSTFAMFLGAYVAFYFAIGTSPEAEAVLFSNRLNGLVSVMLGYLISVIVWWYNSVQIRQRMEISEQRAELERMNRELQAMAFTDSLTMLPNRRCFDQSVKRELAAMARKGHPSSVIEFDLDLFREINNTYGHYAGDEVLRQLAELVTHSIRGSDLVARYGGEEFVVLLPETSLRSACVLAEKLRVKIAEHNFPVEGHRIHVTASFGVMELNVKDPQCPNLYRNADCSLYQAKQGGRNRVEAM